MNRQCQATTKAGTPCSRLTRMGRRRLGKGRPLQTTYKYTALGEQAAKAIADVAPYLMGVKRGRAEKLLVTIAPVRLVKGLGLWTGAKPTLRGGD